MISISVDAIVFTHCFLTPFKKYMDHYCTLPSQDGKGLLQAPGGLLLGATQLVIDEPFKRYPTAQEKVHSAPL